MANFNFNKVILGGRLCADPELKQTNKGDAAVSFNIAVNRRYQKEGDVQADFFTVTAYRQTAEFVCKFFRKGSSISIVGELQTRSWTGKDGQKRYATEIVASEAYFVDSRDEAPAAKSHASGGGTAADTAVPAASQYVPEQYTASGGGFRDVSDDEDLPF